MRAQEFITENWGPEKYPGILPIGDYLGPDEHEFAPPGRYKDSGDLHEEVWDLMDAGIEPQVVSINPKILLATQDWLSNAGGDEPLFPEFPDRPVVYDKQGKYYILDGHHRTTAALKRGQPISVYLFTDSQLGQVKEMTDQRSTSRMATGQQVLDYINNTHHEPMVPDLEQAVLRHPHWQLTTVRLSDLNIPDQEYDDEDQEPESDPYDRVQVIDPEHAGEYSANFVDRRPIVVDDQGWIIDGNHRAWAAAELLNRDSIRAWIPAEIKENFADGKVKGKSRPGRVKRAGASCDGSVSSLRAKAKKYGGERGKMYHWCANMKGGKRK